MPNGFLCQVATTIRIDPDANSEQCMPIHLMANANENNLLDSLTIDGACLFYFSTGVSLKDLDGGRWIVNGGYLHTDKHTYSKTNFD